MVSDSDPIPLVEVSLKNVTYVPKSSPSKEILSNVSTRISPFKLTAWLGPSGAGKSTLLSVAANHGDHKEFLAKDSVIRINGEEGTIPKRLVGVVWQDDLLLSNLTVYENIYYSARLKANQSISNDEVHKMVLHVLSDLELTSAQDTLVGSTTGPSLRTGISGGERKRTSVAAELVVSRPSVLLLDEITSGLDSNTSYLLIKTLESLAKNHGHAIAVVIHQPRTAIFNKFDHLLLLSKGGVVYDGPPSQIRTYLEALVGDLPPETGIADWIMDVIKLDENKSDPQLCEKWDNYLRTLNDELVGEDTDNSSPGAAKERKLSSLADLQQALTKYPTSFSTQFLLLTSRTMKQQKGERLTRMALYLQLCYVLFCAIFWWQLPDNNSWIFERNSLLFFMVIAQANGIVVSAVTVFQRERALLRHERQKKLYGVSSYFLGKTVSDMTANVLLPVVYGLVVYWTAGFRPTAVAFFKFLLAYYCTLSTAQSMGLWISIVLPTLQLALIFAPPVTLFFMIMGGFYIRFENMPDWIVWSSWLSFAWYGYSSLIINEYAGREIPCEASIEPCHPQSGDDIIHELGITGIASNYWFNMGMLLLLQVLFRIAAYVGLRRKQ